MMAFTERTRQRCRGLAQHPDIHEVMLAASIAQNGSQCCARESRHLSQIRCFLTRALQL
jgi:hypothetical protein